MLKNELHQPCQKTESLEKLLIVREIICFDLEWFDSGHGLRPKDGTLRIPKLGRSVQRKIQEKCKAIRSKLRVVGKLLLSELKR